MCEGADFCGKVFVVLIERKYKIFKLDLTKVNYGRFLTIRHTEG